MPSSDVRSSETSAQNTQIFFGKNFQKFVCSNFRSFVFRGSYFRVLIVGRKNRKNLDLAKISRYMVREMMSVSNLDLAKISHCTVCEMMSAST